MDWNTTLNAFGREESFTINAAKGSTLHIQRLDAGTSGIVQSSQNRTDVKFQINLNEADFILDNAPLDVDTVLASGSNLTFKSGSTLTNTPDFILSNGSRFEIENGANVAEAQLSFEQGSNSLHSAATGAMPLKGMSFKGNATITADDAAGFTGLNSFGALPGLEVTIGEAGDTANTATGFGANSYSVIDDALINGHIALRP